MVSKLRKIFPALIAVLCAAPHALAADESLSSLQRDVILAKEKTAAIAGKMTSVNTALDDAKGHIVDQQSTKLVKAASAQAKTPAVPAAKAAETAPSKKPARTVYKPNFLDQLRASPEPRVRTAIPAIDAESPLSQLDITPAPGQTIVESAKKKWLQWPKLPALFPKSMPVAHGKPLPYNSVKLSDGEALYKVAVSDKKVTIQEAVDIGIANNLQLRALKKNVEVADAKLMEAKRGLFPTVQIYRDISGGKVAAADSGYRVFRGDQQAVNMTQPLYYGGELTNTVKQAEENVLSAKTEYKKSYNDFIHQVRAAYYGVVKAEYNSQYQIELFEKVSAFLKHFKQEAEQKLAPQIDYLNVESQYYQVLYQVESSKNDVLSANVTLKQTMNLEFEETVPVDLKMDFIKFEPKFSELLARAMESNADMRIKAYQLEAARYGIDIYESKKKPHFELRGSYGMSGENFRDDVAQLFDKDEMDQEKQWFLGIHGTMPLGTSSVEYEQIKHVYAPNVLGNTGSEDWKHHVAFNLFDKFSAITDEKTAQYALYQAESDYQATKNEVTLRLRDDYYSLKRYLIQIDSSLAKLKYQEKQSAIMEYLLTIQEASAASYVENLVNRAQDKYAFIQAVGDYRIALSSISTLIGDPFYFENQPLLNPNKGKNDGIAEIPAAEA